MSSTGIEGVDDSSRVLLIDAAPLLYSSKIDRLDVLGSVLHGYECLTTRAVIDEVERNAGREEIVRRVHSAAWLSTASTESLAYHGRFPTWAQRLG